MFVLTLLKVCKHMRVSYANKPLTYLLTNVSQLCIVRVAHVILSIDSIVITAKNFSIVFQFIQSQSHNTRIIVNVHFL